MGMKATTRGYFAGGTDVAVADGGTGASTARAAAQNLSVPYILAKSYAAVSGAADTNENTLATITVPANAMGANGVLRLNFRCTATNNANAKTLRIRFSGGSGTIIYQVALTSTAGGAGWSFIANTNSTSAQNNWGQWTVINSTLTAVSSANSSIDTTASTTVVITGQKANGADTFTLDGYVVEILSDGA